jgi:zinc transport system substrate-binding protein
VYVSNYPLQYFAERIAMPPIEVRFAAKSAPDPAYWRPDPLSVKSMQKAYLILLNGATYEKWLRRIPLPPSRLVNTSNSIHDQLIKLTETIVHSHGPEGEHEHTGYAITTWLDLTLAVAQARVIRDTFAFHWPDHNKQFEERFSSLEKDLLELDAELEAVISNAPDMLLLFSHPIYQYMIRRYGLKARSVHWEPDEMPHDLKWNKLEEILEVHKAKWMIWEKTPMSEIAEKLKEMGIACAVFDPCGNVPENGDFLSVMKQNIESMRQVFK